MLYPPATAGAHDITYTVVSTDDLVAVSWFNMFYEVIGVGVWAQVKGFDAVTNRIPLDIAGSRFRQLRVDVLSVLFVNVCICINLV